MSIPPFTDAERAVLAMLGDGSEDDLLLRELVIPRQTLRRHYEHVAEKLLSRARSLDE